MSCKNIQGPITGLRPTLYLKLCKNKAKVPRMLRKYKISRVEKTSVKKKHCCKTQKVI